MDNPGYIHIPASLATKDARLFWLLALSLYQAEMLADCDHLLLMDWSELANSEEGEDLASQLAESLFAKDDLPRLQTVSEGFSPDRHPLYFRRLRAYGKKMPQSRKSLAWMQSQKLIGKGFDGFKAALGEGHVELARSLHQPTPAEAEAAFYEIAPLLTKESLGLLLFLCPSLVSFQCLTHAIQARASEEALCFLAWKIEVSKDKSMLRNPDGDDHLLASLLSIALTRKQFSLAKKFLEWNHSLAFEKLEPKELAAPWENDSSAIKLDGSLALTPSDFACLYMHDGFARALAHLQAPPPMMPKVAALIVALGKKLESRRAGAGQAWSQYQLAQADIFQKDIWRSL